MTERLNLLSYRRNLRRRSTSKSDYTRWRGPSVRGGRPTQEAARSAASFIFKQADHVAYWQILFQTVSDSAGSGGNPLRSFGRGNGGLAGRHRLKFGVRARPKEGAGAVSHNQQAAGQQHDILQHEPPAA